MKNYFMETMCELNDKRVAVFAKDLCFAYKKSDPILNEVNLLVTRGHIYSLLGPSGCGKTTLLKCVLGRLKPNRGDITLFGAKPGTPECGVPGRGVGYMPQELGLYVEFTIEELLNYFGKIYSMNKIEIKEKFNEITKLLNLPQNNKLIDQYSGGQKRRISLACALFHSPPLLILDEPTVGTDPMLRKIIWSHLNTLCETGVTAILTTHYIEEARNANVVAFMRSGKILAEDQPNTFLEKYQSITLEEVFVKLCESEDNSSDKQRNNGNFCYENEIIDGMNTSKDITLMSVRVSSDMQKDICSDKTEAQVIDCCDNNNKINIKGQNGFHELKSINKCCALIQKNIQRLTRKWIHFIFFILFPAFQFGLLLYSIGDKPHNLDLAIFNEELHSNTTDDWGLLFVESIDSKIFNVIQFNSFETAMDSVIRGQTYAMIDINERFTKSIRLRRIYGSDVDEETLDESEIKVYIDWSQKIVALQIERYLYEAMIRFVEKVANSSNIDSKTLRIPLSFEEPVYGTRKESLRDFLLPGAIIICLFNGITIVSANLLLEEQKDGNLERNVVAGITAKDFLLSHILTQTLILCFQLVFMLLTQLFIMNGQIGGSFVLMIMIVLSQGFCGVSFGLMITTVTRDHLYATMFAAASFIINVVLSGLFWPIENMPRIIQFCGQFSPQTLPIHALRDILYREWNLTHYEVYMGFIVSYVWFSVFLIIAFVFLRKIC